MTEMINQLKPGAPLDAEFSRIARAIVDELDAQFKRLAEGDIEAIHEIRKWLKRFRGFLRLYRPALGKHFAALDGQARSISKLLASARDVQAMAEAMSLLALDEPCLLTSSLARRLSKAAGGRPGNEPVRGAIDIDLAVSAFRKFRKAVRKTRIDEAGFDAIGAGLARTYRRTRQAFDDAIVSGTSDDFHVLRRHANYHRQHMRMLSSCWPEMMEARAEAGSELHDILGEEHDLHELAIWAQAAARSKTTIREAHLITALANARRHQLQVRAARLASQLYAERPNRFVRRIRKYWKAASS